MPLRWLLSGALFLIATSFAGAEEPARRPHILAVWWNSLWHPCAFCKQPCPDDYCAKPCPACPPLVLCTGVDDYCPKPLPPCPAPVPCTGIDDYLPKPCPKVEPLCSYPPWYSCGLPGCEKCAK